MGSNQDLTNALAALVRSNAQSSKPSKATVAGLSSRVLSGVGIQEPYGQEAKGQDNRSPGVVNRILDIMSRPLYGVLNPVKHEFEDNKDRIKAEAATDPLGAIKDAALSSLDLLSPIANADEIWSGLSGKEKTTGRDITKASEIDQHIPKPVNAALAFGIDVAADPLNMLGAGAFSKLGKAAKGSTEALRTVEEGTAKSAQTISEDISRRAAQQASDRARVVPEAGMPAPKLGDPPRLFEAGPGPVGLAEQEARLNPQKLLDEAAPQVKKPQLALEGPKTAAPVKELLDLAAQTSKVASPVAKNVLQKQAGKIGEKLSPSAVGKQVARDPAQFPAISIGNRWQETAKAAADSFLKNNRLTEINHIGQTNLYNKILHAASKVRKDRRPFHVFQMLRIAEDQLLAAGRKLTDADGISMRLSDLANVMGGPKALNSKMVDEFRKVAPSYYKENLKVFTTPAVVNKILDPVIKTGSDLATAAKALPPSQTVMIGNDLSKALGKIAQQAGASSREAKTAREFIHELFNPNRDKLYTAVEKEARSLVRQTSDGVIDPKVLHKISEEVYSSLGANPKVLGRQIEQSRVVEGVMTKFATWWGAKDLKPFSREYIDTARNVAAAFSETMKPLVAKTTNSQRKIAWSVARGKQAAGSPEEQALADQFKYITERLMGTHGITDNAEAVVMRSATLMKELNDELPQALKFISNSGTDKLGRRFDYTNGQWMHSWKEWDVKEPAEALYQLTRTLQMVTRKNAMWDDAAVRWGLPTKSAEYQHIAKGVDRLKGTYFPKQIADQLSSLQNQLNRDVFKTPNKTIELFDKVQRVWKTGVTIYSPSHHIRNLNGDIYLAALDGVTSVRPYTLATKVLHAFPTRYKSMESVFNIMDPGLRETALRARPGNHVLTTARGDKLTAEQIYQAAESQGLFARATHVEDLAGDGSAFGTFGPNFKPFGGRVNDLASKTSELRDHWVRLAHFVDVLSKSRQPLAVAVEQAGRRVRKFHPDGMDLTGFEQNVMRRVIPFYSWMRKATPLVIEGAVQRPHITLAFPKAMANMQLATGIESEGPGDPFPVDQMFPDWLREKGIGPILQPGSGLGRDENWRGEAPGYTIVNPTNPFIDQIQQLGDPTKTLLGSLSPVARIPIELMTQQTSLGIPLGSVEGGVPGYLAQQVPAVGTAARLTGATRDNEPYNPEQLINWLTGAGVTGTGPYKSQAQVELRDHLAQLGKKNRGDYR